MKKSNKKDALRRLAIISGHLSRVYKMVQNDQYCVDVLHQSMAVQRALQKVDAIVLDSHLHSCVRDALQGSGKKSEQSTAELLEIFERSRR